MQTIRGFFQHLADTDQSVLQHCPESSRRSQARLGAMVLVTTVLACISGGYAAYTAFRSWVAAILIGGIYGAGIMTIDRMIVSATNRWAALARVPVAIGIGLVIAVPLELKLAEDQINRRLLHNNRQQNKRLLNRLKEERGLPGLRRRIDSLSALRAQNLREAREARETQQEELAGVSGEELTGVSGKGPAWRGAVRREKQAIARAEQLKRELERLRERRSRLRSEVQKIYNAKSTTAAAGLVARYKVLKELAKESPSVRNISWGIRLLIVLFELAPALLKVLRSKTVYESLLEARRVNDISRVQSFANKRVNKIKQDPENPPTPRFLDWFQSNPLST